MDFLVQGVGELISHTPEGNRNVPWVRLLPGEVRKVTRIGFKGRTFYPSRFRDDRHLGETLLDQGVREVLRRDDDPLVIVDNEPDEDPRPVAVFFAPAEEKKAES